MKISTSFSFECDGATFVCKKPNYKDLMEAQAGGTEANVALVFSHIVSIKGLEIDGVQADTLTHYSLPLDAVQKIVQLFHVELSKLLPKAEDEKK